MSLKMPPLADFEAADRVMLYFRQVSRKENPKWIPVIYDARRLINGAITIIKTA